MRMEIPKAERKKEISYRHHERMMGKKKKKKKLTVGFGARERGHILSDALKGNGKRIAELYRVPDFKGLSGPIGFVVVWVNWVGLMTRRKREEKKKKSILLLVNALLGEHKLVAKEKELRLQVLAGVVFCCCRVVADDRPLLNASGVGGTVQ